MATTANASEKKTPQNGRRQRPSEQLAVLSEALSRLQFARAHGLQYNRERDIYEVGGYPRLITFIDLWDLYSRDPVAAQVIDMIPDTTWRNPPELTQGNKTEGTEFLDGFQSLVDRLNLWNRFGRADRLARIGRYGVLFIGTPVSNDTEFREEMSPMSGPDDVLYLAAYHENEAQIKEWVTDPGDPRFGLPLVYDIKLSGSTTAQFKERPGSKSILAHWSRVIHIAEDLTGDDVYGRPILQTIFNDLMDLQKISTSTAEGFWQMVAGILQVNIDKEVQVAPDELEKLDNDLQEIYHDLRRYIILRGGTLERTGGITPNPAEAANLSITRIAAGSRIPKRMLFGSEIGERSSTEDQKSYLGMIQERQLQFAEPMILREFIDRLITYRGLDSPEGGEDFEIVWPALVVESERDIATSDLDRARTAKELAGVGGVPLELVEIDEKRRVFLRPTGEVGPITPEELEEIITPPEPEPIPGMGGGTFGGPPPGGGAEGGV